VLGVTLVTPIILGLVQGAGFGLVAIGLVLIYKSTRVFNFAAGEFATMGAFASYHLTHKGGLHFGIFFIHLHIPRLPLLVGALAGILMGALFGLLVERLVVRPLSNRPKVTVLVASAATATVAINFEIVRGATKAFSARALVSGHPLVIRGVNILWQELFVIAALVLAGVGLAIFFGYTDLGLATLATSQEPTASRLMGIRLNRVSMLTWGLAGALGGLAGVLLPPVSGNFFAAYGTTDLLIAAFTAAVLGGMTSIPGAFLGGILVGLVQNLALSNIDQNHFPGAPAVAVLVVLIGVLVVRPTGLLGKEA
jgi:branched-chain amino acid transport system permease protein